MREKILIVDDSRFNREILNNMVADKYDVIEADDGMKAIEILQQLESTISLVLLDIVMPELDGFDVLAMMSQNGWIDYIPVIMISSEDDMESIHRAYEMGVTDFIKRPFDEFIVQQRIINTMLLYSKQKKLIDFVEQQMHNDRVKYDTVLNILSNLVEFRHNDSGQHSFIVSQVTEAILDELNLRTDKYEFNINDISIASTLHDIGKIAIEDKILNKPDKLTESEFDTLKKHTVIGAHIIASAEAPEEAENIIKLAYNICMWHHERWDGSGYPDQLKGDDIPIEAQVVGIADAYDALISNRAYRKPFSHGKAVEMIIRGECGEFNPLLVGCLLACSEKIYDKLNEQGVFK